MNCTHCQPYTACEHHRLLVRYKFTRYKRYKREASRLSMNCTLTTIQTAAAHRCARRPQRHRLPFDHRFATEAPSQPAPRPREKPSHPAARVRATEYRAGRAGVGRAHSHEQEAGRGLPLPCGLTTAAQTPSSDLVLLLRTLGRGYRRRPRDCACTQMLG